MGIHASSVLQFVLTQKVIFVKFLPTFFTGILLHVVELLHVLLETVFVGKFGVALLTRDLKTCGLYTFMVYLFVPLEMGVPGKILVTKVAFKWPLASVTKLVGLEATRSAKCLIAADVAARIKIDTGTSRGDSLGRITGIF